MTELYQKVIDKLDAEAEKANGAPLRAIEEMLRAVCANDPGACEKVLAEDKTLKGAYEAMYEAAKKRKERGGSSNCVCICPDEAKQIIFRYYGITTDSVCEAPAAKSQTSANVSEGSVMDLFDLIG